MGASLVRIRWNNDAIDRLTYINAPTERLTDVPKWLVMQRDELVKKNFCYVAISAEDPYAFKGVDAKKLATVARARSKALRKFSDSVMNNEIRWCVASLPASAWAKRIFPEDKNAKAKLSSLIEKTMRLDAPDPEKAWEEHINSLKKRADFLNAHDFDSLIFENAIGTHLTVGLADNHLWLSANEKAKDGVEFIANMPTEEIFTAPHKNRVNGIVKSAMPLCHNGQIVDGFSITFKNGKIIDYSAEKGADTLKGLIETDEGCLHLGEVALIGKNSPIAKTGVLFYNTLFDENASCHLAIGKAYPTTVKGGENLSENELNALGVNDSIEHVDFMIGTPDLRVYGVKKSGEKILLLDDGDWII